MIFIMGFSVIRFILRIFFGGSRNKTNNNQQQSSNRQQSKTNYTGSKNSSKVFSNEEGEYVEYEEITD